MVDYIEVYESVWKQLKSLGFDEGDDITYLDFVNSCEDTGVDEDIIDLDVFCENYNINIG